VIGKPIIPRALARHDIEQAIDWYVAEAGAKVALGFVDAIEAAYRAIARNRATGSPLYAQELGLPGLRSRKLRRYPYLVFYMECDEYVDVWRVLHAQRDIPVAMQRLG
jgi:toxin ParE1/3/4